MSLKQNFNHLWFELFIAPKEQEARRYQDLDPKIAPLVAALGALNGVRTIASCQGHAAGRPEAPYVYFQAPIALAQHLTKVIRDAYLADELHHYWEMSGAFNEQYELTFSLSSPYCDANYLEKRLTALAWGREEIDQDIQALTRLILKVITP
ncbi:hypothetical protein LQM11_004384 [Vibrio parahaemolyticus]|nr:hypothetical protein [Vibrio parahaemolyticus]